MTLCLSPLPNDTITIFLAYAEQGGNLWSLSDQMERMYKDSSAPTPLTAASPYHRLRHYQITYPPSTNPQYNTFTSPSVYYIFPYSFLPRLFYLKKCTHYRAPAPSAPPPSIPDMKVAWEDVSSAHAPSAPVTHHGKAAFWFWLSEIPPPLFLCIFPARGGGGWVF